MSRPIPDRRNPSEDEEIAKTIVKAQERGRTYRLLIVVVVFVAIIAAVLSAEIGRRARIEQAALLSVEACERQHALIEMQRLFLQEHAAIRLQLKDAGVPNRHAHPSLLEELNQLIEEGDCIVGEDVGD